MKEKIGMIWTIVNVPPKRGMSNLGTIIFYEHILDKARRERIQHERKHESRQ